MALVVIALSFGVARAAADGVKFGVNDDEGMFQKGTGPFFSNLTGLGMHDNTVTVRWDETSPNGFEVLDPATNVTLMNFLPATVAAAGLAGVTLTFDVYPRHSQAAGDPATNAPKFAAWLTQLAKTFPSVTHYVVMNECNQPLFVNPQYDASGNLLSAADCGEFLAAGYQALKAVNPANFVWGIGLSPHGAKVDGQSHRDSSPFDFLSALGTWYKASKYNGQPIMDGLDLHPYPIPQSTPFAQGNSNAGGPAYGVATLPLAYQAFYDAFKGTAQPTVGPGRLPVSLNEVGIQTVPSGAGYTGAETAGWGIEGATGTEDYQAQWYKQMIDATQCDASITNVNIFKLLDQSDLGAWQSGLFQLGWVAKQSAQVVRSEIASVSSCPSGAAKLWSPSASPAAGPKAKPAKKPAKKKPAKAKTPAKGKTPPAKGKTPPAKGKTPPAKGKTPPGKGKTPPGKGKTPPGKGKTPPANGTTPPGKGKAPPAKGKPPIPTTGKKGDQGAAKPGKPAPPATPVKKK
jgi:hypothetical protein